MESGGKRFLDIVPMGHVAEPVVDAEPEGELKDPALLSIDGAGRLDEVGNVAAHLQGMQLALAIRAGDLRRNFLDGARGSGLCDRRSGWWWARSRSSDNEQRTAQEGTEGARHGARGSAR